MTLYGIVNTTLKILFENNHNINRKQINIAENVWLDSGFVEIKYQTISIFLECLLLISSWYAFPCVVIKFCSVPLVLVPVRVNRITNIHMDRHVHLRVYYICRI